MKRIIVLLLAICTVFVMVSCKEQVKSKKNDSENISPATKDNNETFKTSDMYAMEYVMEARLYAAYKLGSVDETDEYVSMTLSYLLSKYGYGTLAELKAGHPDSNTKPADVQSKVNAQELGFLFRACFGDKEMPEFDEKYIKCQGDTYEPATNKFDEVNFKIVNVNIGKASVCLNDADGNVLVTGKVYFDNAKDNSPYPLRIIDMKIADK